MVHSLPGYFIKHSVLYVTVILFMATVFVGPHGMVSAQVHVSEDTLIIPTYLVDPPNPMPRFYEGRTHQGVQRRVYPYPMNDGLTRIKEDQSYPIVYFGNEYINLGIMPGLGGRIFFAEDKTNDYVWFYRQHVIKPSLIGMLGYWISGSNAWGFPHHHGPNTVKPMDYQIEDNPDGGKTIWIANTDQRHRMRILLGYTIFPHSSIVEMNIRLINPTPVANSFLFWANPSVHVDTTYQVIFPPSVQYVTQHAKREMTTWPIADRRYNRFDYEGVDISWWKNIGVPSSFFSWAPKEDYFGGYDHGKQAGTVWIGNHHTTPGMKFWAWGNNPGGDRANDGLTDEDGHYIELMAGAYTDNQPDYSWLQPYEEKNVQMIWFPMRELEGLKYANRNGALNLEMEEDRVVRIRMNTTSPHKEAVVVLKTEKDVLHRKTIDIDPAKPYALDLILDHPLTEDDLEVSLLGHDGHILLAYKPAEHHPPDDVIPEALRPPAPPEEIKTIEELYLTGLRLNQFYNASLDPMDYYNEALKRDPEDYRVNTQLGILCIKGKEWKKAEDYLRLAVARITSSYTRPKDGEALYYLGVALKAQGKLDEAYDTLYRASWSGAWHTAAYSQLAEIDCQMTGTKKNFRTALNHLNQAISTNTKNTKLLCLRAVVLRKLNQLEDATQQAESVLKQDVLNHLAKNELIQLASMSGDKERAAGLLEDLQLIMRDDVQSYLELATDYINCGFFDEAVDVLSRLERNGNEFPMLYYYLGYCWSKLKDQEKAKNYYQSASRQDPAYCFPFRAESVDVLNHAMKVNPNDARAPYYLGNLLYEYQPQKAIAFWKKARELDDTFYIVHRNLAVAHEEVENDIPKALASMEKAVACTSHDPRLLFEMDRLYEKNKVPSQKRYELLKNNEDIAKQRSETLLRLATRAVEYGQYDEAIEILLTHSFPQFEGGQEMQETYLNAFILRGLERLNSGKLSEALNDFETALAFPVGRWGRSRWAQFHYLIGSVYEAQKKPEKARVSFENVLKVNIQERGRSQEFLYYHGLALNKLGRSGEAKNIFEDLLESAKSESGSTFFRQFEAGQSRDSRMAANLYLTGLAYEGLGKKKKAREAFSETFTLNPGHVWSRIHLEALK